MEKTAVKVANMTRRNAQASKVKLFNEFCDSRGIPREPLDLNFFYEDEPFDDEKTLTDEEDGSEDTDDDEEDEASKGKASIPVNIAGQAPSSVNLLNQSHGAGAVGTGEVTVETETGGADGGAVEGKTNEAVVVLPR